MPMTEPYIWRVIQRDGTVVCEYPDPSRHVSFREVDPGAVATLIVEPNARLGIVGAPHAIGLASDTARAIFFRRYSHNLATGERTGVTVFGWQDTVGGRNVKTLCWLHPDGSVLVTDHDPQDGEG